MPIPLYPDYKLGFFSRATRQQLDAFAPDIIHISTPDIIGRTFLLYAKERAIPVASAFHTDFPSYLEYYHLGFAVKPTWRYLRWFYNKCDVTLAPNESVQQKLESHGIINVASWSRGIDKELFDPSRRSEAQRTTWKVDGKTVFIYAGRFVPYKDTEVVMQVYERFMQSDYANRVAFVMIGSGPDEEEMRRRMPDAIFTGYLTGADLPTAYACGDLFFFPSTTEAFCNVTLEALACGLPSIVSDVGGCRDVVERSSAGLVARSGNSDDFYAKCLELFNNPERYQVMRERGLAYAEQQSWAAVNGALIERYRRMVNQAQR
jgi:glycosyltransferase involved in cell wall biosynthesis